jgi:uncharacterized protein YjiS (DUF1127 family)
MKHKIKRTIQRIFISMIRAQEKRAVEHILYRLSKRELDDIGISRSDISRIAAGMKK